MTNELSVIPRSSSEYNFTDLKKSSASWEISSDGSYSRLSPERYCRDHCVENSVSLETSSDVQVFKTLLQKLVGPAKAGFLGA